jgi:hypothetical protein
LPTTRLAGAAIFGCIVLHKCFAIRFLNSLEHS